MVDKRIRFQPVEVVSQVWFVCGSSGSIGCRVRSIILVPLTQSGSQIVPEVSLPEIFLQ